MKYEKIYIKDKIINHLISNGRKEISEGLLLKTFKELQKTSLKESKKLINVALISSTPIFKMHKIVNKKRKKKVREIPVIIRNKKARTSLSIKFILSTLKKKNYFHIELYKEIILNAKNEGLSIRIKNKIQKEVLLKKHFFYYYRWR